MTAPIDGTCDPRFARLRDAFIANFTERAEPGGAIALMVDGRLVCDLWGGHRDAARRHAWSRDTLVNFFSVGKAFTSLVALRLVERGALDLDAPAHRLWPEFGAHGKEEITLRHMLSHQAGLPAIRKDLPDGAMFDWSVMTAALAATAPWWEPGAAHGYHVNTFGYLVGELVRRRYGRYLDPASRNGGGAFLRIRVLRLALPLVAAAAAGVRIDHRLVLEGETAGRHKVASMNPFHCLRLARDEAAAPVVGRADGDPVAASALLAAEPWAKLAEARRFRRRVRQGEKLRRPDLDDARAAAALHMQHAAVIEAVAERVDLRAEGQDLAAVEAGDGNRVRSKETLADFGVSHPGIIAARRRTERKFCVSKTCRMSCAFLHRSASLCISTARSGRKKAAETMAGAGAVGED